MRPTIPAMRMVAHLLKRPLDPRADPGRCMPRGVRLDPQPWSRRLLPLRGDGASPGRARAIAFACGCRENPDPRVVAVGISNHTPVSPSGRRRIAVSAPSSRPPIGGFNTAESFPDNHASKQQPYRRAVRGAKRARSSRMGSGTSSCHSALLSAWLSLGVRVFP